MQTSGAQTLAINCRDITKVYRTGKVDTYALRGVSLSVSRGELFMLVGPSGCGKTTLISVIAGILNQDEGEVQVFGTHLRELSEDARTRFRGENVGFVFQSFNLIPTLTAAENVTIPLLLSGSCRSEADKRARLLLERVGLGQKCDAFPLNLSGGQQQRVAIARALVHSPRLIVCDEPTSALDFKTGAETMQLFREIVSTRDTTVVIVTHDSRIYSYADRIGIMNDGIIQKIVSPHELEGH